jgi:hypothetical protein
VGDELQHTPQPQIVSVRPADEVAAAVDGQQTDGAVQQAEAAHVGSRWEKSVAQSGTGLVTILLRVPVDSPSRR